MLKNIITNLHQLKYTMARYIVGASTGKCSAIKPGIFRCESNGVNSIVALYTISSGNIPINDLEYIDIVYHMKRFLNLFSIPGCKTVTYFSLQPINIDSYISQINHKLQMKLVELELDKSNTKLRSYVEKLIDIRRRILRGVTPIDLSNIIAFICSDDMSNVERLSNIEYSAKNSMNIILKPVMDPLKALHILNF